MIHSLDQKLRTSPSSYNSTIVLYGNNCCHYHMITQTDKNYPHCEVAFNALYDESYCSSAHFIKRVNYPDRINSMISVGLDQVPLWGSMGIIIVVDKPLLLTNSMKLCWKLKNSQQCKRKCQPNK